MTTPAYTTVDVDSSLAALLALAAGEPALAGLSTAAGSPDLIFFRALALVDAKLAFLENNNLLEAFGSLCRLRQSMIEHARSLGYDLATATAATATLLVEPVRVYRDLVPDARALRRVHRATPSTSGFVVLAGVWGATAGITHHGIWFSDDERREFSSIADGRLADDPTIYGCVSGVTDASQAPAGHENWFLLVNTPAGVHVDAPAYEAVVLERLAAHGVDLRERLVFTETITPAELEARYRSPGGAIYGTSSNGRRAAFVRPANRGARRGLYLVGGSSHPGGGLPLVTMSARIVDEMIEADR